MPSENIIYKGEKRNTFFIDLKAENQYSTLFSNLDNPLS